MGRGGHRSKKGGTHFVEAARSDSAPGMWLDPGATALNAYTRRVARCDGSTCSTRPSGPTSSRCAAGSVPRLGHIRLAEVSPVHLRTLQTELLKNGRVDEPVACPRQIGCGHGRVLKGAETLSGGGSSSTNPMGGGPCWVVDAEMVTWNGQARGVPLYESAITAVPVLGYFLPHDRAPTW